MGPGMLLGGAATTGQQARTPTGWNRGAPSRGAARSAARRDALPCTTNGGAEHRQVEPSGQRRYRTRKDGSWRCY